MTAETTATVSVKAARQKLARALAMADGVPLEQRLRVLSEFDRLMADPD
jgi:hypothetical protein